LFTASIRFRRSIDDGVYAFRHHSGPLPRRKRFGYSSIPRNLPCGNATMVRAQYLAGQPKKQARRSPRASGSGHQADRRF
jgi:hypothetical protein